MLRRKPRMAANTAVVAIVRTGAATALVGSGPAALAASGEGRAPLTTATPGG
jgi:hypothetical protein